MRTLLASAAESKAAAACTWASEGWNAPLSSIFLNNERNQKFGTVEPYQIVVDHKPFSGSFGPALPRDDKNHEELLL